MLEERKNAPIKKKRGKNRKSGYREIYMKYLGCDIPSDYDIHHIDENPKNNDVLNLVAIPRYIHQEYHTLSQEIRMSLQILEAYLIDYDNPSHRKEYYPRFSPQYNCIDRNRDRVEKLIVFINAQKAFQDKYGFIDFFFKKTFNKI